jgi:hypothetical protein
MLTIAPKGRRARHSNKLLRGAASTAICTTLAAWSFAAAAQAPAPAKDLATQKIPALASVTFAWLSAGGFLDPSPGIGHGPIRQDPDIPFHGNNQGPGRITPPMGNYRDPVLKPWAAAAMRASNEEVQEGKRGLPFSAQGRCYPGGVPGQLLYPAEPFYFIQTQKEVWMVWQRDHMVRRIYLTDKHSQNVKPSWFGESIGHYEDDGTLAIDTIALSTRNSFIDNYRTPHSEKEHVVERYKLSADGGTLEADVTVTDPDAFNEPLHMLKRWRKVQNPMRETVCAENNGDTFGGNLFPIPQTDTPDF